MLNIEQIVRRRKTSKLLLDPSRQADEPLPEEYQEELRQMLESAGWAPFHKPADRVHLQGDLPSVVPWRFYVLDRTAGKRLNQAIKSLAEQQPDSGWSRAWSSKIPKLVAAAGYLVQVTWLPDPGVNGGSPELSERNIEHIAAASAAIQNLLLCAEARGWYSYWSTGGILKEEEILELLGIPTNQKLLGAIFLTPGDLPHDKALPGALRLKRGKVEEWTKWVALESSF